MMNPKLMVSEDINYGAAFSRQFFPHEVNELIEVGLIQ